MKVTKLYLLVFIALTSCSDIAKPYYKFEFELREAICNCISLKRSDYSEAQYWKEYEKCQEETTSLLKRGLDNFEEDPRLSKIEYEANMDSIVLELSDQCLKRFGRKSWSINN